MKDVKRDFKEKLDEIELYFGFMEKAARKGSSISLSDGKLEKIEPDLAKTLKANGFLLLYNLVESSMRKAIEEIYFSIKREGISFDDVKEGIRREIVIYLKNKKNADEFVSEVNSIAKDIFEVCFSAETLFAGNVDARKIKELAKKYGFVIRIREAKKREISLLTVKTRRNGLAHGDYSFKECGKDYSIPQMLKIKNEVTSYLNKTLDIIEVYIDNKDFLK